MEPDWEELRNRRVEVGRVRVAYDPDNYRTGREIEIRYSPCEQMEWVTGMPVEHAKLLHEQLVRVLQRTEQEVDGGDS